MLRVPHPIPYQGSKRRLARVILDHAPAGIKRLIEPFAGSAATTLAAAARGIGSEYVIGDSLAPLAALWQRIIADPNGLADEYEVLWAGQRGDARAHYLSVRQDFNRERDPVRLLYLLARCVKNAVRFNPKGEFNQSADHRRTGMNPVKMREEIRGASRALRGRASVFSGDYAEALELARPSDLVYMDPPYQGVSDTGDPRYFQQLNFDRLMANLESLNSKGVAFLLSFDGTCGKRSYGRPIPNELKLTQVLIHTGKSSQATLNGQDEETVESLYLSPTLSAKGGNYFTVASSRADSRQLQLLS